ncbi:M16 family metallopeptidase [Brachybacterium alimentarium]|uniref:Peptidase M16 n=1 Tax=Brachybacterium alimentarium TaxID=47845 RepID=A0A2A3YHV2_9MICO|nr:pitrilysin family protein [Brachybacterium alimentarium]PCC34901.1 peptidase M16 [Brachybacterium alimentarium]PCC38685.1 peptidase M16 [Brachybacterium alimentarium]RCS76027.1 insulinase family protein [Brachybacterium alimentarium]RCS85812.1 insulinase family protein [Brachybacterium alimentarium]
MPSDLAFDDPSSDVMLDPATGVRRSILPGGVRLLTQTDRSVRSAAIGLWLPVGSRDEAPEHAGSTHVLEHLMFKGTSRRSAMDIATAFDEVGGDSNAITAKEHTLYYGRVRSADVPMAVDVLTDMITGSLLEQDALATEREVILEELAMAEDDPNDVGYETFLADVLGPDTPIGRPVGGTAQSVNSLSIEDVRAHWAEHYRPDNLVITAVGDLDHDGLAELIRAGLRRGGWTLEDGRLPARRPRGVDLSTSAVPAVPDVTRIAPHRLSRTTEQNHIYLGGHGLTALSEDRHALSVLMSVLGGGMSSRLFQNIREQRGLAYSVYSFSGGYRDAGLFGMYAACRPGRTSQVVELLAAELARMGERGIDEEELSRAKGQITGSFALGLEDTSSRMGRLGTIELVHGTYTSVDETLEKIGRVGPDDVRDLAARLAGSFTTRVEVGPDY